jgi:hypothetical protein
MGDNGLLSDPARLLLRAISHTGPEAVAAFSQWRAVGPLDAAHGESHRVLPLLVELIQREGLDDPDLARMRGVARQVWTNNVLRLRLLFSTLDALDSRGIGAVLMKGAALFARTPELERRRVSADYDILLLPEDIPAAVSVLREGGFLPPGHAWEDFGAPLIDSVDAGVEVKRGSQRGLDLHWRPLWNIHDPDLGRRYRLDARDAELHGRAVRIPSATHQLFCSMARCEPWDRIECFTRVTEGYFLLASAAGEIDWDEFGALTRRYGLECAAAAYLGELQAHAELDLPASAAGLGLSAGEAKYREWRIRAIPPGQRSSSEHAALQRQDFAFGRSGTFMRPPGQAEERLRAVTWPSPLMDRLWSLARQRVAACPPGDGPVFLEGFSSPEKAGRWSEKKWAIAVVPLTDAQAGGEPLRLNAHAYRGRRKQVRIGAAGGLGTVRCLLLGRDTELGLSVRLKPLPELGGRGLLLLWLPDAEMPAEGGGSTDKRQLGLFIRRQWDRRTDGVRGAERGSPHRLRRLWLQLPLPESVRQRLSPAVAAIARQVRLSRLSRPLPASAIGAGDVVFCGQLSDIGMRGRAARLALEAVRHWPLTVVPHDLGGDPAGAAAAPGEGGLWICHGDPTEAVQVMLSTPQQLWARRYRIGIWPDGAVVAAPGLERTLPLFHEIWVHDDAAVAMVRAQGGRGETLVHVVSRPAPDVGIDHPRVFLRDRPFRFLAQFDMRAPAMHTGAIATIRSFQAGFDRTSRSASLVLSLVGAGSDPLAVAALSRVAAGRPNIVLVTKALSDSETLDLVAGADCLLALHRPGDAMQSIVEAMCAGTPVIAARWSGAPSAALVVEPVPDPIGPDRSAADAMLRLVGDQSLWAEKSRAGTVLASRWRAQSWPVDRHRRFVETKASPDGMS